MPNYKTWVHHGEGNSDDLTKYGLGGYNATNEDPTMNSWSDNVVRYESMVADAFLGLETLEENDAEEHHDPKLEAQRFSDLLESMRKPLWEDSVLISRWIRVNPRYWNKLTSGVGMAVESVVNNLVLKELMEPAVTRPTTRITVITVVNPCRRGASRGVRIAVTDLTSFLPIQSYGGLAAKVLCTFHPTAEILWDSTRYLKS
ncbi:hypothetical protein PIB30_001651 [Stylosanthes scabra]|uniref:Uncharacterized protein n=1 Tax=Stylosanthes scabra TaxID=79078 RepID=A0ABU6T4K0_9FABA|nr:hypothetical protein [Stylosanthes scabra]